MKAILKILSFSLIGLAFNASAQCPAGYPGTSCVSVTNIIPDTAGNLIIPSMTAYCVQSLITLRNNLVINDTVNSYPGAALYLGDGAKLVAPKITINNPGAVNLCVRSIVAIDTLILNDTSAFAAGISGVGYPACVSVRIYLKVARSQNIPAGVRLCLGRNIIVAGPGTLSGNIQYSCSECFTFDSVPSSPVIPLDEVVDVLDINGRRLMTCRKSSPDIPKHQFLIFKRGQVREKYFYSE